MRLAAAILVVALFQSAPPQEPAWPPAGVLTEGVTAPIPLRQVGAGYTPAAVRAGIQGFVTLQFVVEPTGEVGPVRVLRSLDRVHGLDDAAVAALKQWLFKPGTKDGVPARVLAVTLMVFNLNGLPPPLTLPAGFESGAALASAKWIDETVDIEGLTIKFAYPEGWQRGDSTTAALLVMDPDSGVSAGVARPMRLPGALPFPMSLSQLAGFSETMRTQQNRAGHATSGLAVGQSPLGSINWLWLEMEMSTANFKGGTTTPTEVAAAVRDSIDGVHLWAFSTGAGSQLVQVLCSLPGRRDLSPAERDAALALARESCAGILKRMSITVR